MMQYVSQALSYSGMFLVGCGAGVLITDLSKTGSKTRQVYNIAKNLVTLSGKEFLGLEEEEMERYEE